MAWFDDLKTPPIKPVAATETIATQSTAAERRASHWVQCPQCSAVHAREKIRETLQLCPSCQHHFRMSARERVDLLSDPGSFVQYAQNLQSCDPLKFDDVNPYRNRLKAAAAATGMADAFLSGRAQLTRLPFHLGVFEFGFMGGSMGVVVGEKVCRVLEAALQERLPAVVVCASGGARMQEGVLSLVQMAKTSALIGQMRAQGLPYLSILTDPTTGGVAASFAMLGDLILAEPRALIGFAGPRVIEQTLRQKLPEGFQRSEFLRNHGFVDRVVARPSLAGELAFWLRRLGKRTCDFPVGV